MTEILKSRGPWIRELATSIKVSDFEKINLFSQTSDDCNPTFVSRKSLREALYEYELHGCSVHKPISSPSKICQLLMIEKTSASGIEENVDTFLKCEVSDGIQYIKAFMSLKTFLNASISSDDFAGQSAHVTYSLINIQEYELISFLRNETDKENLSLTLRLIITKFQWITHDIGTLIGQPCYVLTCSDVKTHLNNMLLEKNQVSNNQIITNDDMEGIELIADQFTQTFPCPVVDKALNDYFLENMDCDSAISDRYREDVLKMSYYHVSSLFEAVSNSEVSNVNMTSLSEDTDNYILAPLLEDICTEMETSKNSFENCNSFTCPSGKIAGTVLPNFGNASNVSMCMQSLDLEDHDYRIRMPMLSSFDSSLVENTFELNQTPGFELIFPAYDGNLGNLVSLLDDGRIIPLLFCDHNMW